MRKFHECRKWVQAIVCGVMIFITFAAVQAVRADAAEAAERTVVPCWAGYDGEWDMRDRIKPRSCMFNGGEAHAFTTPIAEMTWRSWGRRTACGRGVYIYNQGYRARVRFCLYGKTRFYGNTYGYTKIRGRFGTRQSWVEVDGRRVWRTRKPSRFSNSTW